MLFDSSFGIQYGGRSKSSSWWRTSLLYISRLVLLLLRIVEFVKPMSRGWMKVANSVNLGKVQKPNAEDLRIFSVWCNLDADFVKLLPWQWNMWKQNRCPSLIFSCATSLQSTFWDIYMFLHGKVCPVYFGLFILWNL